MKHNLRCNLIPNPKDIFIGSNFMTLKVKYIYLVWCI